MREILFRGKQIDNGEWVYGAYQPPVEWGGRKWGVSIACVTEHGWLDDILVIPETVGQFTGMYDRNGKKIFEGDCINHHMNVVEFCSGAFFVGGDRPLWLMAKYGEVIGSIHDNPELLNRK